MLRRSTMHLWELNGDLAFRAVRQHGELIVDLTAARCGDDSVVAWLQRVRARCVAAGKGLTVAGTDHRLSDAAGAVSEGVLVYADLATALARAECRVRLRTRPALAENPEAGYENLTPLFRRLAATTDVGVRNRLRESIIEASIPLADHIAARFAHRSDLYEDLQQVARMALVLAVDRFDATRGTEFLSFAIPTVMGEVRKYFRDRTWAIRIPRPLQDTLFQMKPVIEDLEQTLGHTPTPRQIAESTGIGYDDVVATLQAGSVYTLGSLDEPARTGDDGAVESRVERLGTDETGYRFVDEYLTVKPLLAQLSEQERLVLRLRYYEDMSQSRIAERIGVSQMQVSRILNRTLSELRRASLDARTDG